MKVFCQGFRHRRARHHFPLHLIGLPQAEAEAEVEVEVEAEVEVELEVEVEVLPQNQKLYFLLP